MEIRIKIIKIETLQFNNSSSLTFQKLGGKIEEVTCKDLIDLSQDLYYLILQKLKEKALDLEEKIDKWRTEDISLAERNNMNALEKDLIKVGI